MFIIAGMTAMTLAGCQQQDELTETPAIEPSYVLTDLALSLPASSASTRLGTDVVQADGLLFRGIQKLSIIPFSKQGKVESGDNPSYYDGFNSYIDRTTPTLNENLDQRFRYYTKVYLMNGVASFLTYGQAASVEGGKSVNGSLIPKVAGQSQTEGIMPDRVTVTPDNISFELEQIYQKEGIPAEATAIANYLTYIASAEATINAGTEYEKTESWKESSDGWLNLMYMNLTNQGSEEANVMAGSARNVKVLVNTLYTRLAAMNYTEESIEKAIADNIMQRISSYTFTYDVTNNKSLTVTFDNTNQIVSSIGDCDAYPNDLDLPDGTAVLLWDKTANSNAGAFVPQIATTPEVPINTISRFAYPAELYYYGNSRINTSNDEVPSSFYENKNTWTEVLTLYPYENAIVSGNTKAVAIRDLLQYGVAHLSAKVRSTVSPLPDADGEEVIVGETTFPVKGIIVCGQKPVDFEFKPKTTGDELFIYDSYLDTNTGNKPFYLKTTAEGEGPFQTLVLQSQEDKDVTVMLELQNNSDKNFKGEDGIVYKGTNFYLMGQIKLSDGSVAGVDEQNREDVRKRVFTQDHTTTLTMKVSSLAHAYNVMPNILAGRLEIGVDIKLDWMQAKPTTVIISGEDVETTDGDTNNSDGN